MSDAIQTIIQAVIQDAGGAVFAIAQPLGDALLAADAAGLTLSPALRTIAQVGVGQQQPTALVPVMNQEMESILSLIDGPMEAILPKVSDQGKVYTWETAKQDPGSLIWYLAAVARAAPQDALKALENVFRGINFMDRHPTRYGQDPITILVLITTIVGLAAGIITLVNTISSALKKPSPAPAPSGGSTTTVVANPAPSTPDTTSSGPDLTVLLVIGVGVWFFFFRDDKGEKKAA